MAQVKPERLSDSNISLRYKIQNLALQKEGIRICHINAQSLKNKIEDFRLTFEGSHVDVICVTETWLKDSIPDSYIALNGYKLYRKDRKTRGGGVALFINENIATNLVYESNDSDLIEYKFIEIISYRRKLLIGCAYKPNRNTSTTTFLQKLEGITGSYNDLLIAGDFNSDFLKDLTFHDDMMQLGLFSVNLQQPTHYAASSKQSTLLDIFFVKDKWKILLYDQLPAHCFSRHYMIYTTYDFAKDRYQNQHNPDKMANGPPSALATTMERSTILSLSVSDLRRKLRGLGLFLHGRKITLQNRLLKHFNFELLADSENLDTDNENSSRIITNSMEDNLENSVDENLQNRKELNDDIAGTTLESDMDRSTILNLSVADLRTKLKEFKLVLHGSKKNLQNRLLQHYGLELIPEDEILSNGSEVASVSADLNLKKKTSSKHSSVNITVESLKNKLKELGLSLQGRKIELQNRLLDYYELDLLDHNEDLYNNGEDKTLVKNIDRTAILNMTVQHLKEKLRALGLGTQGRKVELQNRLLDHFNFDLLDNSNDLDNSAESAMCRIMNRSIILSMTVEELKEKLREQGLGLQGRKIELQNRLLAHNNLGIVHSNDILNNRSENAYSPITNDSGICLESSIDRSLILSMTVKELKEKLSELDLSLQGQKIDLQNRLLAYYHMDLIKMYENLDNSTYISPQTERIMISDMRSEHLKEKLKELGMSQQGRKIDLQNRLLENYHTEILSGDDNSSDRISNTYNNSPSCKGNALGSNMDRSMILSMRVADLKEKLRELGLNLEGRKSDLQNRLLEYYQMDLINVYENLDNSTNISPQMKKSMDTPLILDMNVEHLKDKLRELGMSQQGRKIDLQNRLLEYYHTDILNGDDNSLDHISNTYNNSPSCRVNVLGSNFVAYMDRSMILSMRVEDLKGKLRELGMSQQGRKIDLQNRLLEYYHSDILSGDDNSSDRISKTYSNYVISTGFVSGTSLDRSMILSMRVEDLRNKLRELGLNLQGRKIDLQNRLLEYYHMNLL